MQAHSRRGRKWRRLSHKYGIRVFVGVIVALVVALVGAVMYVLTSMNWRMRY